MAGLQTPVKRNCLQPIQEYKDETRKGQAPGVEVLRGCAKRQEGEAGVRENHLEPQSGVGSDAIYRTTGLPKAEMDADEHK